MDKRKINLLKLMKKNLLQIRYKNYRDKLQIFYKNRKGRQPKPIIIKQYLVLEEGFFEGLGLYIGECERSKKGKALSFTNTDMDILKFIILWFKKYFGIDKKELMATVILPKRSNYNRINQKFSKILKLNSSQFTRPSFPISNPGNLYRVRIFRNKTLYRTLFESIFKEVIPLCLLYNRWGHGFLRGFYAA